MSKNKRYFWLFVTGLISYIVGTVIYTLIFQGNSQNTRFIFGVVFGILILFLLNIFMMIKYPKVIKEIRIEDKDEREQFIRQQAAYMTLGILLLVLLIAATILILLDQTVLALTLIVGFWVLLIIYLTAASYYRKKY